MWFTTSRCASSRSTVGAIDERAAGGFVAHVALLFEDPHGRQHGVIRQRRIADAIHDLGNGEVAAGPEDIHEAILSLGEGRRLLAGHAPDGSIAAPTVSTRHKECGFETHRIARGRRS